MVKRIIYQDITIPINETLLHQELAAALGDVFIGIQIKTNRTQIALLGPTADDLKKVEQLITEHNAEKQTAAQDTYAQIAALIKPLVGKPVLELATPDRWALLFALLYQNKALADDMTVRPFAAWVSPQDHDYD